MDFLIWLEQTGLGTWVRESNSIWAFPTVIFLHTLGLAFLVGTSTVVCLRTLGFAHRAPIAPLENLFPIMWAGLCVNALSGAALFIADATTKLANPFFCVKMVFVALAVVNMRLLKSHVLLDPLVDKRPVQVLGKVLAMTSILLWIGAITAGRLIAYLGPVSDLQ